MAHLTLKSVEMSWHGEKNIYMIRLDRHTGEFLNFSCHVATRQAGIAARVIAGYVRKKISIPQNNPAIKGHSVEREQIRGFSSF